MSDWLEHLLPPKPKETTSTVALTEKFMAMDAALSKVQAAVDVYHEVTHGNLLDLSWDAVLTRCEEATTAYLSLTAPDSPPKRQHAIDWGIQLAQSAIDGLETFHSHYGRVLNEAANAKVRAAIEMERAREEAARKEAELQKKTQLALDSVPTRLEVTRARIAGIQPALSTMYKEFAASCSADLVNNQVAAQGHINQAVDYLSRARAAQQQGEYEEALAAVQKARLELGGAEQLIDVVPQRLQTLQELRDHPEKRSEKVWFALRDAQRFCVHQGLTKQWASVLDAQVQRIQTLEASLKTRNPDYWAYNNGLDKVSDFIQAVVVKMRQDVRR